jgi:hypothetical protein
MTTEINGPFKVIFGPIFVHINTAWVMTLIMSMSGDELNNLTKLSDLRSQICIKPNAFVFAI